MGLNLYFSKVDLATMLESTESQFNYTFKKDFPDMAKVKNKKFSDVETYNILKKYRSLLPDEEIKAMIYPRKRSKIGFTAE